tara:strand:+ start:407 stop:784 length:378 start_codon:yes stop_codon:yes gene_type:complete
MKTNENRTVQDRIEYQCEFVYHRLDVFLELYTSKNPSIEDLFYSSQFDNLLRLYEQQQKFIPMIRHLSYEYDNNYKILICEIEKLSYYDLLINDSFCESDCCKDSYKEVYNKFKTSVDKLKSLYW